MLDIVVKWPSASAFTDVVLQSGASWCTGSRRGREGQ